MTNRQNKKPLKVMIIEDEQDILLLYKDYLISRGHNVLSYSYLGIGNYFRL